MAFAQTSVNALRAARVSRKVCACACASGDPRLRNTHPVPGRADVGEHHRCGRHQGQGCAQEGGRRRRREPLRRVVRPTLHNCRTFLWRPAGPPRGLAPRFAGWCRCRLAVSLRSVPLPSAVSPAGRTGKSHLWVGLSITRPRRSRGSPALPGSLAPAAGQAARWLSCLPRVAWPQLALVWP